MTEDRLQSLLNDYAEPVKFRPPAPRAAPRWRYAVVGGTAMAAAWAMVLIPRPTPADVAARRIEAALAKVETMRAEGYLHYGDKAKERLYERSTYREGHWRFSGRVGTTLEQTYILKGGRQYTYDRRFNTVTAEPYRSEAGFYRDLFQMIREQSNIGLISEKRTERVEEGPRINGRETYRIVSERPADEYRSVLLVDEETNLPISAEAQVHYANMGGDDTRQFLRFTYRFDADVPMSEFDPKQFGRPILDIPTEAKKLMDRVRAPRATVEDGQVHDAQVTSDGTIYALTSIPRGTSLTPLPDSVADGHGTRYLRLRDLGPGDTWGNTSVRQIVAKDRSVFVTTWIPLEPPKQPATRVHFSFVKRRFNSSSAVVAPPSTSTPVYPPVSIHLTPNQGRFPTWSTVLMLNKPLLSQRIEAADARADWYRDRKQHASELRWRWRAYEAAKDYVPRFGELKVPALVKCLRALGKSAEADRVQRELGPQPIKRYP